MKNRIAAVLTCGLLAVWVYPIAADVRTDEKSHVEFPGMLGKVVNFFGGKSAREGVTATVAVKGNRMARLDDTTGQIIDLGEQKVYDLDMKKKTYRVTTFAELRQQIEEAKRKAEEQARSAQAKAQEEKQQAAADQKEPQVDIDVDLKESGQKKTINGFDTHEVVMTITVREKGKKLEDNGGMVLTSSMWLAPKIAAMKEITDFELRFMRELQLQTVAGASPQEMASAMAMYPMMKDAIARMNTENVKMDGTAILTTVKTEVVKSADQVAQEQKAQADQDSKDKGGKIPTSVGGLLGGFAKKAAAKKKDDQPQPSDRATFMTITSEVLKVSTTVGDEVAIPSTFRLQ